MRLVQQRKGALPDRAWLKLARMPVMVPKHFVCEIAQVVIVAAVVLVVKALHIPRAHHGHKRSLEDIWLLYELVLEDVSQLGVLHMPWAYEPDGSMRNCISFLYSISKWPGTC